MKSENQCFICAKVVEKYCNLCNKYFCSTCSNNYHSSANLQAHKNGSISFFEPKNREKFEKIDEVFKNVFE